MNQSEYFKLCETIKTHNHLYYNLSKPIISDKEFDKLITELKIIEQENPHLNIDNSPLLRVGSEPISEFEKVLHKYPMLSIEKVYNEEELKSFVDRIIKVTNNDNIELSLEYKVDGLSISLIYEDSKLVKALTRGDGITGENVLENIKVINSIPLTLPSSLKDIEIRGEIYMSFSVFDYINNFKRANGEQLLANPRNAASGALKRRDPKISRQSKLSMIAYDIINPISYGFNSQYQILKSLKDLGFETPKFDIVKAIDIYKLLSNYDKLNQKNYHYPIDGAVIKINDIELRNNFENTSSHPKWLVAYKFQEEIAESKVLDIKVQVGKTGTLTPVAILEPTELGGSIIRKASLHNYDMIKKLDVRIGDYVNIKKAGEIIPQIIDVIKENRLSTSMPIEEPTECPICNSPVETENGNVALICQGINCPAKLKGKIEYWASKDIMNIDGLGPAVIEQLCDKNLIDNIIDLYCLDKNKLNQLERMGDKSISNLLESIEKSKESPFEKVLAGLQIPNTGRTTSLLLAKHFGNINALINATIEDLIDLDGIGEKSAESIYNWFRDNDNKIFYESLINLNFNMIYKNDILEEIEMEPLFLNETVCVTGSFDFVENRNIIHTFVKKHGGKATDTVSKNTTILLAGRNVGSKLTKAEKLGIKIVGHDMLKEMMLTEKEKATLNVF